MAERIVFAMEQGLSNHIIMPALMNVLPIVSRGPAWLRRGLELIGDTDYNVTNVGMKRAIDNGYHKTLAGEEDQKLFQRSIEKFNAAAKN